MDRKRARPKGDAGPVAEFREEAGTAAGDAPVLVTGATGFIGWHVVNELLRHGYHVRALVRPESEASHLRSLGVDLYVGRIEQPETLAAAARGVHAVVHLAAVLLGPTEESYRRVNVDGTMNLLDAVQRFSPDLRRFVFVSSLAALGPTRASRPPDEDAPAHPVSFYGRTKLEAEAEVVERARRFPVTIIRPPLVYGPRDGGLLPYFRLVRAGIMLLVDDGGLPISLIHGADVAAAVRAALWRDHASPSTFFVADGPPRPMRDLAEAIRRAQGTPALPVRVPAGAVRLASRMGRWLLDGVGRVPDLLHPDWLDQLLAPGWTCSDARIRRQLGWTPTVALGQGLDETVDWYRRTGWLKGPWPGRVNGEPGRTSNGPRRRTQDLQGGLQCET